MRKVGKWKVFFFGSPPEVNGGIPYKKNKKLLGKMGLEEPGDKISSLVS